MEIYREAEVAGVYDVIVAGGGVAGAAAATARYVTRYSAPIFTMALTWANFLPVQQAREIVYEALKEALQKIGRIKPYRPTLPAALEFTFYRSDFAVHYYGRKEWERLDARTVRKVVHSFAENMW